MINNQRLPHYLQSLPLAPHSDIHDHETWIQHNIHELKISNMIMQTNV